MNNDTELSIDWRRRALDAEALLDLARENSRAMGAALMEQSDRIMALRYALALLLIPHDLETVHTPDAIRAARAALRDTE